MMNVIKLMSIMTHSDQQRVQGLIMSIDFENCFDMVDHMAIEGLMIYFNFPEEYICWTMLLFTHFQLCCLTMDFLLTGFTLPEVCIRDAAKVHIFLIYVDKSSQTSLKTIQRLKAC